MRPIATRYQNIAAEIIKALAVQPVAGDAEEDPVFVGNDRPIVLGTTQLNLQPIRIEIRCLAKASDL